MLKSKEGEQERLPESFDAQAALLNKKFARLEADLKQMREELHAAEEQSERLCQQLLDGRST